MVGGVIGLAIALALVVTATILARVTRDRRAAVLFALVALAYAGIGGLLLLGGHTPVTHLGAPHVLVAATALVVFSAVLTISTGGATPLLLGATAAGAVLGAGAAASLVLGTKPAGSAAIIAAIGLAWIPLLPMLGARMARLPIPAVPTGPDDLKADEETLDGRMLRSRADRADGLLSALVGSTAAILLGCEVVLSLSGGLPAQLFCCVLALVLLLRARPFAGRAPRAAVLTAGTLGFGLLAVAVFFSSVSTVRLAVVLGGLVAFAVISLVYGLGIAGKRIAPIWGRTLDIIEILLIIGAVPLAIWVSGLYGWVRGLHA
jgi:type VII secretion integral membrane protein EccD